MKAWTLIISIFLAACSVQQNESTLTDTSPWSPGKEKVVFKANKSDCNEYFSGFFGCKKLNAVIPVNVSMSPYPDGFDFRIAHRIYYGFKFQCKTTPYIKAQINTKGGDIEILSSTAPDIKPIRFVTFEPLSALNIVIPAHSSQIDAECGLTLTSWFALPVAEDVKKTWDGLKQRLQTTRTMAKQIGPASELSLMKVAVDEVLKSMERERASLIEQLALATDEIEIAILKANILKLDQKIGDKNCGDGITDCGLTLAKRNLSDCDADQCNSFVGEAFRKITTQFQDLKRERDSLFGFITNEIARIRSLNEQIESAVSVILKEIEGDRNEG